MDTCWNCGAGLSPGIGWCGQCFEPVVRLPEASDEEPSDAREARFWRALWDELDFVPNLREHFAEEVSEGRSRAALLKLSGLLHDVAKPETRAPDATGRIRFFGHAERGAES
jgi:hypothetical protein